MWKCIPAVILGSLLGLAPGAPAKKLALPTPASMADLALDFLHTRQKDAESVRFFSWHGVPESKLPAFKRVFAWWINQLSFEQAATIPQDVPGSGGLLQWVDIEDYRWNAAAFQAVAERDRVFEEPWVPSLTAQALRRLINQQSKLRDRYPVLAVVWAPQFFRDTVETDRVSSYYDLLFARQRFVKRRSGRIKFVDFPKNEADLEKAVGIDLVKQFGKEQQLDLDYGAIVAGGDDDAAGSIVARNNRLLVFLPIPTTLPGWYGKTFDVTETAGEKDYTETLIFKGGKFKRGQGADAVFDAGEILFSLPNGGQGGILINEKANRIETAGNNVAKDTSDTRMDARVRTFGSCVCCHGPSGGFIYPKDVVSEMLDAGIDIKFKDRKQANRIRAFFRGWQARAKTFTVGYESLVEECTKDLKTGKSWKAAELAKHYQEFRDWYDSPLSPQQAGREIGVSSATLKRICFASPKARLLRINRGFSTPRKTWEKDVFREVQLLGSLQK